MNDHRIAAVLFGLCLPIGASAQFQVYQMPGQPISPTETKECADYAKQVAAVVRSINAAHDSCLSSAASSSAKKLGITQYSLRSADSAGECTEPQCQSLHDQRHTYQSRGEKRVEECSATVAEYRTRESNRSVAQRQREQLSATARDVAITGAGELAIRGAGTAVLRGGGKVLGNPALGIAQPLLDPENGKNLYDATAAQRREGKSGSRNTEQSRMLDEQERVEKAEAERNRRNSPPRK